MENLNDSVDLENVAFEALKQDISDHSANESFEEIIDVDEIDDDVDGIDENSSDLICAICDKTFEYEYEFLMHDKLEHAQTNNAEEPIEPIEESIESMEESIEPTKSNEIQIGEVFSLDQTEMENSTPKVEDSRIVTKLYECPLCLKKLVNLLDTKDHIEEFHGIDKENQSRLANMGLKIKEMPIF